MAEEERRKAETPSDIEVAAPSVLPGTPSALSFHRPPSAHMSQLACLTPAPGVTLGALVLSLSSPGPEGGPGAQWAPHGIFW